jgi:hypothetical protein
MSYTQKLHMSEINQKLSQLAGLASAFAKEIELSDELSLGEKFLVLQDFFVAMKPLENEFSKSKKGFESFAKEQLQDGEEVERNGVLVSVKWSKPVAKVDTDKLEADYSRLLADYNQEYDRSLYIKFNEPAKKVIISPIIC